MLFRSAAAEVVEESSEKTDGVEGAEAAADERRICSRAPCLRCPSLAPFMGREPKPEAEELRRDGGVGWWCGGGGCCCCCFCRSSCSHSGSGSPNGRY